MGSDRVHTNQNVVKTQIYGKGKFVIIIDLALGEPAITHWLSTWFYYKKN